MIVRKGESVAIGSLFKPISGTFNLADYEIKCRIKNLKGRTILYKTEGIIRNDEASAVAYIITGDETKLMSGLNFVSFELWTNGQMVMSNDIEQITIIG